MPFVTTERSFADGGNQTDKRNLSLVIKKLFQGAHIDEGVTTPGIKVRLGQLNTHGVFGIEVDCQTAVTIWYKASADNATPGDVMQNVLVQHTGGGKKLYRVEILPLALIWVYATAPATAAVDDLKVTLNIW